MGKERKMKLILAMVALACGIVIPWGDCKAEAAETEVSRSVHGGDHGATVNFGKDIAADNKNHTTRANIAAGSPLVGVECGATDCEFVWGTPKYISETQVKIDGTVKITDGKDQGYKSNFHGKIDVHGDGHGDNTWDFSGRLMQKCAHTDMREDLKKENCVCGIIEKIIIGQDNPRSVNRNGQGAIAQYSSFGFSYVNETKDSNYNAKICEICGKKYVAEYTREYHTANDFVDNTNRSEPGDYEIFCRKCREINCYNIPGSAAQICQVRVACMAKHKCEYPQDTCQIEFVPGKNRIISSDGNTLTVLVGDTGAVRISPAHYAMQADCLGDYGKYEWKWGEPCGKTYTMSVTEHIIRNMVDFNRPGIYEIKCAEVFESSINEQMYYDNKKDCEVKKTVIVKEKIGEVKSITAMDTDEGHEKRKVSTGGTLEIVAPANVRFEAEIDGMQPSTLIWKCATNGAAGGKKSEEFGRGEKALYNFSSEGNYTITLESGEGDNKKSFSVNIVVRVPPIEQHAEFTIASWFKSAVEKLNGIISNLPLAIAPNITPPTGSIEVVTKGWEELSCSPLTYQPFSIGGNANIGASVKARTPTPLPSFMEKYINAEVFIKLGIQLGCTVGYAYAANDAGTAAEGSWQAASGGSAALTLSAGAEAKAGDWVSAELVGASNGTISLDPVPGKPELDLNYTINPLVVKVAVEVYEGQFTYTDEWKLVDSMNGELAHWNLQ